MIMMYTYAAGQRRVCWRRMSFHTACLSIVSGMCVRVGVYLYSYTCTACAVYEKFDGSNKLKALSSVVLYFCSVFSNLFSPTFSSVATCAGADSQQNHAFDPTSPVVPHIWLHVWDMWVCLSSTFWCFISFSPSFLWIPFSKFCLAATKSRPLVRQ